MILSAQGIFKSGLYFIFNFNTEKDFIVPIEIILSEIKENILVINEILGNLSKDIETMQKKQMNFINIDY